MSCPVGSQLQDLEQPITTKTTPSSSNTLLHSYHLHLQQNMQAQPEWKNHSSLTRPCPVNPLLSQSDTHHHHRFSTKAVKSKENLVVWILLLSQVIHPYSVEQNQKESRKANLGMYLAASRCKWAQHLLANLVACLLPVQYFLPLCPCQFGRCITFRFTFSFRKPRSDPQLLDAKPSPDPAERSSPPRNFAHLFHSKQELPPYRVLILCIRTVSLGCFFISSPLEETGSTVQTFLRY